MLAAALIDAYLDRAFAADDNAAAAMSPALAAIMALCARQTGTQLITEAVPVPIEDYAGLSVEDFMVSLYNDHAVQRLLLVTSTGARLDMQDVLAEAGAALDRL
jgi:hypothetical protein